MDVDEFAAIRVRAEISIGIGYLFVRLLLLLVLRAAHKVQPEVCNGRSVSLAQSMTLRFVVSPLVLQKPVGNGVYSF